MNAIYGWIKDIVIYMILNTIMMNLLGNSNYKKYVSVASGMLLILIVVSPITKALRIDHKLNFFFDFNQFAVQASDFNNRLTQIEKDKSDEIFREFADKIKDEVRESLELEGIKLIECDVIINKDADSDNFATITGMNIKGSYEKELTELDKKESKINRVIVPSIDIDVDNKVQDKEYLPSPIEIKIKDKLSDFYNLEPDNININIQGG